jgi:2-dehydropantoate 2-reductase
MKIAVVGAGAIGGVVAFHLAKAGLDPLIVARPASAALLSREGIIIDGPDGSARQPVRASADPARAGPQDVVLVGFKAHDWSDGLPLVTPLIGPDTLVAPMLNGIPWWYPQRLSADAAAGAHLPGRIAVVDPDGALSAAIPAHQIIGAVVYIGANRTAANRIGWNGRKRLILGEPDGALSPRLAALAETLHGAGLEIETTADIRAAIWVKLLGNACFNPVSAITGATIDAMLADEAVTEVLRAVMQECRDVAGQLGVAELPDVAARLVLHASMRGVKTSMLQDMEAGRPLELAALVDAVVELGRAVDAPTPMLAAVGALARAAWRQRWAA